MKQTKFTWIILSSKVSKTVRRNVTGTSQWCHDAVIAISGNCKSLTDEVVILEFILKDLICKYGKLLHICSMMI